jgi:hypothetical protein
MTIVALLLAAGLQVRPDFSGEWVLLTDRSSSTGRAGTPGYSVAGLLGERFVARQDANTLTLEITLAALGRPVRAVYRLDGSESRNLNPSVVKGVADEPIVSTASWDADALVIRTRGTTPVDGKVTESRRVIRLDADGRLTIDRTSDGAPATRSVYRRVK